MRRGNRAHAAVLFRAAAALDQGEGSAAVVLSNAARHNRRVAHGLHAPAAPVIRVAASEADDRSRLSLSQSRSTPDTSSELDMSKTPPEPADDSTQIMARAVSEWLAGGAPMSPAEAAVYARGRTPVWKYLSSLLPDGASDDERTAALLLAAPELFSVAAADPAALRVRLSGMLRVSDAETRWRFPAAVVVVLLILRYPDYAPAYARGRVASLRAVATHSATRDDLVRFNDTVLDALLTEAPNWMGTENLRAILAGAQNSEYDTATSTAAVIRGADATDVARMFLVSPTDYGRSLREALHENGLIVAQMNDLLVYMEKFVEANRDTSGLLLENITMYSYDNSIEDAYSTFTQVAAAALGSIDAGSLSLWSTAARLVERTRAGMLELVDFQTTLPERLGKQTEMRKALAAGRAVMDAPPEPDSWQRIAGAFQTARRLVADIQGGESAPENSPALLQSYASEAVEWYLGETYPTVVEAADSLAGAIAGGAALDIDLTSEAVRLADTKMDTAARTLGITDLTGMVPGVDRAKYLLAFYRARAHWLETALRVRAMDAQTPDKVVQAAFTQLENDMRVMVNERRLSTGYEYPDDSKAMAAALPSASERSTVRWICIQVLFVHLLRGKWRDFHALLDAARAPALDEIDSGAGRDFARTCMFLPGEAVQDWLLDAVRATLGGERNAAFDALVADDVLVRVLVAAARLDGFAFAPLAGDRDSVRAALAANFDALVHSPVASRAAALLAATTTLAALRNNKRALAATDAGAFLAALFP